MSASTKFRFGIITILVILVLFIQYSAINFLQRDVDAKISQCHEAVNQSTLLLTALINKLQEKNIVNKSEILLEAQTLSADLKAQIQKIESEQKYKAEIQPTTGPPAQ